VASARWNKRSGRSSKWIRRNTRLRIYARDLNTCVYCGSRGLELPEGTDVFRLTLDHVVPRTLGGSNRPDNLVTCCLSCNSSRQHRDLTKREQRRACKAVAKPLPPLASVRSFTPAFPDRDVDGWPAGSPSYDAGDALEGCS
jgi:5-methylcytosine-specific restriction endonuclease McrA